MSLMEVANADKWLSTLSFAIRYTHQMMVRLEPGGFDSVNTTTTTSSARYLSSHTRRQRFYIYVRLSNAVTEGERNYSQHGKSLRHKYIQTLDTACVTTLQVMIEAGRRVSCST